MPDEQIETREKIVEQKLHAVVFWKREDLVF